MRREKLEHLVTTGMIEGKQLGKIARITDILKAKEDEMCGRS